jgi:hypothetical protein
MVGLNLESMEVCTVWGQIYLLPFIKVTHDKLLNGQYELVIGWLKWELIIPLSKYEGGRL